MKRRIILIVIVLSLLMLMFSFIYLSAIPSGKTRSVNNFYKNQFHIVYSGFENCVKKYEYDELLAMLEEDWRKTIYDEIDWKTVKRMGSNTEDNFEEWSKYGNVVPNLLLNEKILKQHTFEKNDMVLFFQYPYCENKFSGNKKDCFKKPSEFFFIVLANGQLLYKISREEAEKLNWGESLTK